MKLLKIIGYLFSAYAAFVLVRQGITYLRAGVITEADHRSFESEAAKLVGGDTTAARYDRAARQFVIHVDLEKPAQWIPNDFMSRVEACRDQATSDIKKLAGYKVTWKHIYRNRTTDQTHERVVSPKDCLEVQDNFARHTFSPRDLQDLERFAASEMGQRTSNVSGDPQLESVITGSKFDSATRAYRTEITFIRNDLDIRRGDTHTVAPDAVSSTLNDLCRAPMFKEIIELGGTFQMDYVIADRQQKPLSQFTVQSEHCPRTR
jgi:hypothetical protein